MQDPAAFPARYPKEQGRVAAAVKCPRCDSPNTKFCYYNNYNLSQPRHFCKSCRRYWTKGGALRNVPVGGGVRKSGKRPRKPDLTRTLRALQASSTSSTVHDSGLGSDPERVYGFSGNQDLKMPDIAGSFSSLLASSGQFGRLLEGLNANGSGPEMVKLGDFGEELNGVGSGMESDPGRCSGLNEQCNDGYESFVLQSGESSYWPDLGIHSPGSCFQ